MMKQKTKQKLRWVLFSSLYWGIALMLAIPLCMILTELSYNSIIGGGFSPTLDLMGMMLQSDFLRLGLVLFIIGFIFGGIRSLF